MTDSYRSPYDLAASLARPVLAGHLTLVGAYAALINDALDCERRGMGDAGEILRASRAVFVETVGDREVPPQPEYYPVPPAPQHSTGPVVVETSIHGPLTAADLRGLNEERLWLDLEITGRFRPETGEGDKP